MSTVKREVRAGSRRQCEWFGTVWEMVTCWKGRGVVY